MSFRSISSSENEENKETTNIFKFIDENAGTIEIDVDNEELAHAQDQLLADQRQFEMEEEAEAARFDARTEVIIESSKSALAPRTLSGYASLHKQFLQWVYQKNPQNGKRHVESVSSHCPQYICEWIQDMCEIIPEAILVAESDIKNSVGAKKFGKGSSRPKKLIDNSGVKDRAATYSYALKMRASASYWFAYLCPIRCGKQEWLRIQLDGSYQGNPSLSPMVAQYMRALNKTKAKAGEVPTSVQAITARDLRLMWEYNQQIRPRAIGQKIVQDEHSYIWGGYRCRRMLQVIYTLAFQCLLRFDEVLQIQAHHIVMIDQKKGIIQLNLLFRKTNQYGGIKPFVLYINPIEPYLDPVLALLDWIHISRITKGYLFRRITVHDQVTVANKYLDPSTFTEYFRHNLLDINVDFRLYGTHSFRRGGCQWLYSEKRWGLVKICDWGGWSTNFDNSSIIRYLVGWNDDPTNKREDFMNPIQIGGIKCHTCGRECTCIGK